MKRLAVLAAALMITCAAHAEPQCRQNLGSYWGPYVHGITCEGTNRNTFGDVIADFQRDYGTITSLSVSHYTTGAKGDLIADEWIVTVDPKIKKQ